MAALNLLVMEKVVLPFGLQSRELLDGSVDLQQLRLVLRIVVELLPHLFLESCGGEIVRRPVLAKGVLLALDWL